MHRNRKANTYTALGGTFCVVSSTHNYYLRNRRPLTPPCSSTGGVNPGHRYFIAARQLHQTQGPTTQRARQANMIPGSLGVIL